jgi:hypothetical protein
MLQNAKTAPVSAGLQSFVGWLDPERKQNGQRDKAPHFRMSLGATLASMPKLTIS